MQVSTLGAVAIVLQQLRTWPQAVRIIRRKDASGVSVASWSLALVSCVTWLEYGIVFKDPVFIINNVFNLAGTVAILLALVRHAGASPALPLLVALGTTAVVWLMNVLGGRTAVGTAATLMGIAMFLPQVIKVFRSPTSGVSPVTWALVSLSSLSWLAYGLVMHQPAVWISHLVILPCAVTVLGRLALK